MKQSIRDLAFMGVFIPTCLIQYDKLSWTKKIILLFVYGFHKGPKGCFASNRYFSNLLGVHIQSITKYLRELEQNDFIRRETKNNLRYIIPTKKACLLLETPPQPTVTSSGAPSAKRLSPPSAKRLSPLSQKAEPYSISYGRLTSNDVSVSSDEETPTPPPRDNFESYKPTVRRILRHWDELARRKKHMVATNKSGMPIVNRAVLGLDKDILSKHWKYSRKIIIDAITRFANISVGGQPVNIEKFFTVTKADVNRAAYLGKDPITIVPWFFRVVEDKYVGVVKAEHPEVVDMLKRKWKKNVTGTDIDFTKDEESKFIKSSMRLVNFMKQQQLEKFLGKAGLNEYANALFIALDERYGFKSLCIGNLCSDYTFHTLLPAYIHDLSRK